jgi:hypothetical protein
LCYLGRLERSVILLEFDVSKGRFGIGWLRDAATGKKKTRVFKNTAAGHRQAAPWLLKYRRQPNGRCEIESIE